MYKQVDAKKTNEDKKMPIRLIRLSRFINEVVGKRKLPSGADKKLLGKPSVIMKLDIEGKFVNCEPNASLHYAQKHSICEVKA